MSCLGTLWFLIDDTILLKDAVLLIDPAHNPKWEVRGLLMDQNMTQRGLSFMWIVLRVKKFDTWPRFGVVPFIGSVLNRDCSRV